MFEQIEQGYGRSGVLAGYALLVAVYHAVFGGFLLAVKGLGLRIPERISIADMLLLSAATYKLSRLVSKDSVTSFLRAPFTIYRGPAGPSEVKEDVRGTGLQKVIGELLTCPFCVATWIAPILACGLVLQPRLTRLIGAAFTIAVLSDVLQYGVEALRKSTELIPSQDQEQASDSDDQKSE